MEATATPTLPASVSTSSEIHPHLQTYLETTTTTAAGTPILAPTTTPTPSSTIQPLLEVATLAARHFSPSWQMPEVGVVLFTVTALFLVYVCRLAWRSLPRKRRFRRSWN
jgi:hypothetical protein